MEREWYLPETRRPKAVRGLLTGETLKVAEYEMAPLSLGGPKVYTKGPLVLYGVTQRSRDDQHYNTLVSVRHRRAPDASRGDSVARLRDMLLTLRT